MNGPDHYSEAERLIGEGEAVVAEIREVPNETRRDALGKQAMGIWAQAQVHAILAVAAAVATNDRLDGMPVDQLAEWLAATGDLQAVRRG